jgi:hypothetical protein
MKDKIMQRFIKNLGIILLIMSVCTANGQGFVEIKRSTIISAKLESLWDFVIKNNKGKALQINCKGKITDRQKGVIYEATTRSIEVLAKSEVFVNKATIIVEQVKVNKMGQRFNLPSGTYDFTIELYDAQENSLLSSSESLVSVDEAGGVFEGMMPMMSKGNKLFSTSGNLRMTYEYNPVNANYIQFNNNQYTRFEANPSITIKGIPVSSNILLSTEKYSQTSLNQIDLHFDYYRYKDYLQQLVLEKIKVLELNGNTDKIKDIARSYVREKYPELDKIKDKLNDEKFKNIEEKVKNFDYSQSLKETLSQNPEFQKYKGMAQQYAVSSMDSLEKMKSKFTETDYHQLEWYLTLNKACQETQQKADSLVKYKKLYEKYQKLSNKLKTIEQVNYQEILNDPMSFEKYLDRFEGISKVMKWVSSIRNFSTGSSYPQMTDLTLTGMRTNGLHLEVNRKNMYAAVTSGKIDAANYFGLPIGGLNRSLNAVRLGLGKVESSHIFFNYLKIRDDDTRTDSIASKPQDNMVVGAEVQWSLFKDRIIIKSEIAQSYHTLDRMLNDSSNTEGGRRDWVTQSTDFRINSSSHKDRAISAEIYGQLNDGLTTITGYYKHIGSGYVSLGVPFLMKDIERYEGRLTHQMFDRKISLSGFIRNDGDNILLNRAYTSINKSYGLELGLTFKKLPAIRIAYAPTQQSAARNTNDGFAIPDSLSDFKANTNMLFGSLTYQYKIGSIYTTSQVNGTAFLGKSNEQTYNTYNIGLQQNFQLGKAGGLNAFITQYNQRVYAQSGVVIDKGVYTGGEGYFKMGKKYNSSLGFNYSNSNTYPERYYSYGEIGRSFFKNKSMIKLRVSYAKQGETANRDIYNTLNTGLGARMVLTTQW